MFFFIYNYVAVAIVGTGNESVEANSTVNVKINGDAVDSSMAFKNIRCLEAIFESTPQCCLQLVYVLRTSDLNTIFIISIIQSMLSIANSMINEDNAFMKDPKWKSYKKRFPIPTIQFLRHFSFRMCEICCRIGMLALFWCYVGGLWFGVMLGFELGFVLLYNIYKLYTASASFTDAFLSLKVIIVLPPEWIFETTDDFLDLLHVFGVNLIGVKNDDDEGCVELCLDTCFINTCFINTPNTCLCCLKVIFLSPFFCIIWCLRMLIVVPMRVFVRLSHPSPGCGTQCYVFSSLRMVGALFEIIFIISHEKLFDRSSFVILYIVLFFYVVYALFYPYLMPDIRLPENVNIRSKMGYGYLGNTNELARLLGREERIIVEKAVEKAVKYVHELDNDLKMLSIRVNNLTQLLRIRVITKQESLEEIKMFAQEVCSLQTRYSKFKNKIEDMYLHFCYQQLKTNGWEDCYVFSQKNADPETSTITKNWLEKHFSIAKLMDTKYEQDYFQN